MYLLYCNDIVPAAGFPEREGPKPQTVGKVIAGCRSAMPATTAPPCPLSC
jgi:hypothetical protein